MSSISSTNIIRLLDAAEAYSPKFPPYHAVQLDYCPTLGFQASIRLNNNNRLNHDDFYQPAEVVSSFKFESTHKEKILKMSKNEKKIYCLENFEIEVQRDKKEFKVLLLSKKASKAIATNTKALMGLMPARKTVFDDFNHLNERLFTHDKKLIATHVKLLSSKPNLINQLIDWIERSKIDCGVVVGSANTITILNAAKYNLAHLNLVGVRIPHADLSNSNLINIDLSGSDLSYVKLYNVNLDYSRLKNCQLKGIEFGEQPYLTIPNIKGLSQDGKKVLYGNSFIKDLSLHEPIDIELKKSKDFTYKSLRISPNGKFVAAPARKGWGEHYLIVWNAKTGEESVSRCRSRENLSELNYSHDNQWIILTIDKGFDIFDIKSNKFIYQLTLGRSATFLSISPNKKKVYFLESDMFERNKLCVWYLETGEKQRLLESIDKEIATGSSCVISYDCQWLIVDGSLFHIETGKKKYTLKDRYDSIVAFSSASDFILIFDRMRHTMRIYDREKGIERLCLYLTKEDFPSSFEKKDQAFFSSDGSKVFYRNSKFIKSWDLSRIDNFKEKQSPTYRGDFQITSCGEKIFLFKKHSIGGSHFVCLDGSTAEELEKFNSFKDSYQFGTVPTKWALQESRLVDLADGKEILSLENHQYITRAAFSEDGNKILLGSEQNEVYLVDKIKQKSELSLNHKHSIDEIALSPNGRWAFTLMCSNTTSNRLSQMILNSPESSYEYTGQLWDCDIDKKRTTFDFGLGKTVFNFKGTKDALSSFSPDSNWFLALSYNPKTGLRKIKLWNCVNRKKERVIEGLKKAAFSPDSQWFYGCQDKAIVVYGCQDPSEYILHNTSKQFTCAHFSPNSDLILSGSKDGLVKLWDWKRENELLTLNLYFEIEQVEFFPDGCHILIKTSQPSLQKWQLVDSHRRLKPKLIWSTASSVLSANYVQLSGVTGLTEINAKILEQSGAFIPEGVQIHNSSKMGEKPIKIEHLLEEEDEKELLAYPIQFKNHSISTTSSYKTVSVPQKQVVVTHKISAEKLQATLTQMYKIAYSSDGKEKLLQLEKQFSSLPTYLTSLQIKEKEALESLINQSKIALQIKEDQQAIFGDATLSEYYYVFISKWLETWLAAKTIHSEMVENSQKNKIDYIADILDKGASYVSLPGAALLADILNIGISSWSTHDKRSGVNRLASYFSTITEAENFIIVFANYLTNAQKEIIKQLDAPKAGLINKVLRGASALANKITANDIDTPIKELAEEDGKKIIQAIMGGKLDAHPKMEAIPKILKDVLDLSIPNFAFSSHSPSPNLAQTSPINNNTGIHSLSPMLNSVPLSPQTEEALKELREKFEASREETKELRKKISDLEEAKNQKIGNSTIKEAFKKLEAIESIFSSTQINLPKTTENLQGLRTQMAEQGQLLSLAIQKILRIEEDLGIVSADPAPRSNQEQEQIRNDLFQNN